MDSKIDSIDLPSGPLADLVRRTEREFDVRDRRRIALFSHFTRVIDEEILFYMGVPEFTSEDEPKGPWYLSDIKGFEREDWRDLTQRAVETGIIVASEPGFWFIEPEVAAQLQSRWMPVENRDQRTRAFVESAAQRARMLHRCMSRQDPAAWRSLAMNEANFATALTFAAHSAWSECIIKLLEGLQRLYWMPERTSDWRRTLDSVLAIFMELPSYKPRVAMKDHWTTILSFNVQCLIAERSFDLAQALQQKVVEGLRQDEFRDDRRLSGALANLAYLTESPDLMAEAHQLACQTDPYGAQSHAHNMAAFHIQGEHWDAAEEWIAAASRHGPHAQTSLQQAEVERGRALLPEATAAERIERLHRGLQQALSALSLADDADPRLLSVIHSVTGSIQGQLRMPYEAIENMKTALYLRTAIADLRLIGVTEGNLARLYEYIGHRREALAAAARALRAFEGLDDPALPDLDQARQEITRLQSILKEPQ